MVKKFFIAVVMIFSTAGVVNAQISVAPVTNSFRTGNAYYLASASDTISVPAWIYQSAKTDRVVIVNGEFAAQEWTITVAKKTLKSAELSADESKAVMTMTDGTVFESSDMEWLKALKGQPFVVTEVINSYTKKLWRNWSSMTEAQAAGVKEMTAYAAPAPTTVPTVAATPKVTTSPSFVAAQAPAPQEASVDQELSDEEIIAMALQGGAKVEGTVRTRGHYMVTK